MPRGRRIDEYIVYVGFDPQGLREPPRKRPNAAAAEAARPDQPDRSVGYQPRSATTALLSARMSAITTRAPALVR